MHRRPRTGPCRTGGGTNYRTRKLVVIDPDRLEFRASIGAILFCLVFVIIGGCLLYFGTVPIVFDRHRRAFWKGRRDPDQVIDKKMLGHYTAFDENHALQLVCEYVRSDRSSYYSYESNLVLEDGERVNVVDHGSKARIRTAADTLSAFLEKPIRDAI